MCPESQPASTPSSDSTNLEKDSPKSEMDKKQMLKIGLGGTVGGPIFVIMGLAIKSTGSGILVSLVINGFLMICLVMIFSELAMSMPTDGGSYTFSKEALGGYGFLIGWLMWIGNSVFAALSGIGFSLAIYIFLPASFQSRGVNVLIGVVIVLIFYFLNLRNTAYLNRLMIIFTYILVVGFIIYIVISLSLGSFVNQNAFSLSLFEQDTNIPAILAGTSFTFVIFCNYEWNSSFGTITAKYDEIKKPRETIPRVFIYSMVIASVLYWLTAYSTLVNVGPTQSENWDLVTESETPLADAFSLILGNFGFYFMGLVGIIATLTSINAGMQMATHIFHSMARDGFLHKIVTHEKNGIKYVALSISAIFIAFITLIEDLDLITQLSSFIFLISMAVLSVSVIILRKSRPKLIRPWKIPGYPYIPIFSILMCVVLVFTLVPMSIVVGLLILLSGGVFYLFKVAQRNRLLLLIYGMKLGGVIIYATLKELLKMDFNIAGNSINWMSDLLITMLFFSLALDLKPIRQWVIKFNKENIEPVVGGITRLPPEKEKLASNINIIFGIFQLIFGTVFIALAVAINFELCDISSSISTMSPDSLRILGILVFGVISLSLILNGIVKILVEIELRNISLPH